MRERLRLRTEGLGRGRMGGRRIGIGLLTDFPFIFWDE